MDWKWPQFEKFFQAIAPFGAFFIFLGVIASISKLASYGVLTFIYGILVWMMARGFEIEADVKLRPRSIFEKPRTPKILLTLIGIHIAVFVIYLVCSIMVFSGRWILV